MLLQQIMCRTPVSAASGIQFLGVRGYGGGHSTQLTYYTYTFNFAPVSAGTVLLAMVSSNGYVVRTPSTTDGNSWTELGDTSSSLIPRFFVSLLTNDATSVVFPHGYTSVYAPSILLMNFSLPAGKTLKYASGKERNNALTAMSLSRLTPREYLFVRGVYNSGTFGAQIDTPTPNFTKTTHYSSPSNMFGIGAELQIATGTGITSDPTGTTSSSMYNHLAALYAE